MIRLRQLLLVLMIALSSLCVLEPAFAAPGVSTADSALTALPDHPDPTPHQNLPPCHVCCGSNLPAPAMTGPALAVRMPIRAIDIASPSPRLAGLTVSPGSRPPRA